MRFVADTHTLIWAASETTRLSPVALSLIQDPAHERLVSIASAWEITIKYGTGKLTLPQPPVPFVENQLRLLGVSLLSIELSHLEILTTLPQHHRDPFDRLIIAQCLAEHIPIISIDATLDAYSGLTRFW